MSSDNPFEVSSDSYNDRSGVDRDASSAEVSGRTIDMLKQTGPWVRLIGLLMWIGVVFMAIATIFIIGASVLAGAGPEGMIGGLVMGVFYGFLTFVYWLMAKSLTGYSKRINALTASESVIDLEDAMEAQKTFWKTAGIVTAVTLIIYIVILVVMAAGFALLPAGFGA